MRTLCTVLAVVVTTGVAIAVEDSDVLFFAPYEDGVDAAEAAGARAATVTGREQFVEGVRGRALLLDADSLLTYAFAGNVVPGEGTIMMWFRPEWPADDDRMHMLFRAATGNHGGKALNAIYLYKYLRFARLQIYTSNGRLTDPQHGRSIAYLDDVSWEPGTWLHVAATWSSTLENTEMYLYLNGERIAACGGQIFVPDQAPETFDIGGPQGSGTTAFDDVLIFSRPLLAGEIEAIYASYASGEVAAAAELPFVAARELHLRPFVLFARDRVVTLVDYRGARGDLGAGDGRVDVTVAGAAGRASASADTGPGGVARIELPYAEIGPGPATISATLSAADGRELRTGELAWEVPERPEWLGNTLGISDQVPPPWTPVRAEGDAVTVWGREYVFGGSPLPAQVTSRSRGLLRAPIMLRAGGNLLAAQPVGAADVRATEARRVWRGQVGPLICVATTTVEFDGFMRVDLELTPAGDGAIDALELVVPMTPDRATLYHHCNGEWTDLSDAGTIGEVGWSRPLPFVPYVWLGDERGGLAWWCESNWNWRDAAPERAIEIVRSAEGVDLVVRFIDAPATLDAPLRLTFGFMATPVKPLPQGWRDWRPTFVSATSIEGFVEHGGSHYDGCRNIGTLWNTHVGSFSYFPADPAEMAHRVAILHDADWQTVLSYYAMNMTQTGTPDFVVNEREWRRDPYSEASLRDGAYGTVCQASSWADMLLWIIDRTMDETGTDGIYVDCSNPRFCRSREHGCERGRYPLLAARELQRRMYTLVRQKRGDAGFVYSHVSASVFMTTYSFADAILNGEQFNRKDLLTDLTPAKFRAEFIPHNLGVPVILLPTLVKFQPEGREKMPGAEFLAYPFLHDVICVPSWMGRASQQLLRTLENALHAFGGADARFLPYWSNGDLIAPSSPEATVSGYLRQGGDGLLLIAQGPAQPMEVEVVLHGELAALGGLPAHDVVTGEALAWRDDRLVWRLPGRAVQMVIIER